MARARHRLQLFAHSRDGIDVETYGNRDGSDAEGGPKYPTNCDKALNVVRSLTAIFDEPEQSRHWLLSPTR
jgi:hypothetical protein